MKRRHHRRTPAPIPAPATPPLVAPRMRVRFSKTPRTTVTAPAPTPDRLHIGSPAYGFKIKLARPAAPTQEPMPKVELTPEHREMIRAAKVREILDKIGEASGVFPHMRQDVLAEVGTILSIDVTTGEVQNLPEAMKVARAILKDRRDAVMTNESAKGF